MFEFSQKRDRFRGWVPTKITFITLSAFSDEVRKVPKKRGFTPPCARCAPGNLESEEDYGRVDGHAGQAHPHCWEDEREHGDVRNRCKDCEDSHRFLIFRPL